VRKQIIPDGRREFRARPANRAFARLDNVGDWKDQHSKILGQGVAGDPLATGLAMKGRAPTTECG
jgi:hypothetical protein